MTFPLHKHVLSQDQIVAAIYETMIRPELCDRFDSLPLEMAEEASNVTRMLWSRQAGSGDRGAWLRIGSELTSHFQRAEEILEQAWQRAGRPSVTECREEGDRFWIILTPQDNSLRASRMAENTVGEVTLADLPSALDLTEQAAIRLGRQIDLVQLGAAARQNLLILPTCDPNRKYMCRWFLAGLGADARYHLMIERLDAPWSTGAEELLRRSFGLHAEEIHLTRALLSGQPFGVLADELGISEDELCQRVRTVMAHTGAPGLAEAVRLYCFLISEADRDDRIAVGALSPDVGYIQHGNAARTQYFKFGAETGQPVIFVHGVLDGIAGVQRLQAQFRARGFRVYAPLRTGYGLSGDVERDGNRLDSFVDQIEALIAHENLQRPLLLGHRAGAMFTHVAARRLRGCIAGAVIVAAMGPVEQIGQLSAFKGHQRVMAMAARKAPRLLPLAVKSWTRSVGQRGPSVLLGRQTQKGSSDRAQLARLDLARLLQEGHDLSLCHGGRGLMADFQWLVRDWRRFIDGPTAPVIYLHGGEDRLTPAGRLRAALSGRDNTQLRLCQDIGTMLLYARPELVFSALEDLSVS